ASLRVTPGGCLPRRRVAGRCGRRRPRAGRVDGHAAAYRLDQRTRGRAGTDRLSRRGSAADDEGPMRLRPGAVPGRSVARGPHRRRYRRAECDPQLSPSRSPWVPVPLTPQAPIPQPGRDNGPAGDQARDFATGELAMAQRLTDHVVAVVDEAVLA